LPTTHPEIIKPHFRKESLVGRSVEVIALYIVMRYAPTISKLGHVCPTTN